MAIGDWVISPCPSAQLMERFTTPAARFFIVSPHVSCTYWAESQDTCTADCGASWIDDDEREALTHLKEGRPDVIVLDICMPGMDGIETLGQVLSRDNTIPVILHTAFSSYKDNFMTWSADAYVVKSAELGELKQAIREILSDGELEDVLTSGAAWAVERGMGVAEDLDHIDGHCSDIQGAIDRIG